MGLCHCSHAKEIARFFGTIIGISEGSEQISYNTQPWIVAYAERLRRLGVISRPNSARRGPARHVGRRRASVFVHEEGAVLGTFAGAGGPLRGLFSCDKRPGIRRHSRLWLDPASDHHSERHRSTPAKQSKDKRARSGRAVAWADLP